MSQDPTQMIVNHWGPAFTQLYGHYFPETYLCVDTEYTGGNAEKDVICEWGHTMVEGREIIDRKNFVLNWFDQDIVPHSWVRGRLRHRLDNSKGSWRITEEIMRSEGLNPFKVFEFIYKLCDTWRGRGLPFVAHNGFFADERMLKGNLAGFIGKEFSFGANSLFDTGAIFKATLAIQSEDEGIKERRAKFFPTATDTLESYFRRVTYAHCTGIHWNLMNCLQYYGLHERYQIDFEQMHNAGYDSWCTHLLMEEFRRYITHNHSGESGIATVDEFARMIEQENAKGMARRAQQLQVVADEKKATEKQGAAPAGFAARRAAGQAQRRRGQRAL